jgi:hypothetical protein
MFLTFEQAEIRLPVPLSHNSERLWSYVGLNLHIPWFYVEYSQNLEDFKLRHMLLISNVQQLSAFAKDNNVEITKANIVTPSHINKTDGWQMDRLKLVLGATKKEGRKQIPINIFILEDGRKFIYSPYDSADFDSDIDMENLETLFSI